MLINLYKKLMFHFFGKSIFTHYINLKNEALTRLEKHILESDINNRDRKKSEELYFIRLIRDALIPLIVYKNISKNKDTDPLSEFIDYEIDRLKDIIRIYNLKDDSFSNGSCLMDLPNINAVACINNFNLYRLKEMHIRSYFNKSWCFKAQQNEYKIHENSNYFRSVNRSKTNNVIAINYIYLKLINDRNDLLISKDVLRRLDNIYRNLKVSNAEKLALERYLLTVKENDVFTKIVKDSINTLTIFKFGTLDSNYPENQDDIFDLIPALINPNQERKL